MGHRRDSGFVQVLEMIGRQGAELCGQGCAVEVRQLLGMQLDRQAVQHRRLEHPADLGGGETDPLAEGVDGVGQTSVGGGWDDLVADQVDGAAGIAGELRRQGVGGQQGRRDAYFATIRQGAGGAQGLQFIGQVQAIAGLDLHCSDALGQKGVQARQGLVNQFRLRGGPGSGHG